MDLKLNLDSIGWLSGKKHVDRWLIYSLGLFGLALLVGAGWLAVTDWRQARAGTASAVEREAALAQLMEPVQSLKRVLISE